MTVDTSHLTVETSLSCCCPLFPMSLVWQLAGTTIPSDAFVVFSGGKLEMRKGADALKCRGCDALTVAFRTPEKQNATSLLHRGQLMAGNGHSDCCSPCP